MKYFTIIALFVTVNCSGQKLFSKNNCISYLLCGIAGASDGMNDAIVAHDPYPNSQFWSLYAMNSYENKDSRHWFGRNVTTMTSDGYHLTKFVTYTSFCFAIGIQFGEKQNWKQVLAKTGISLLSFKTGEFIIYNTIK